MLLKHCRGSLEHGRHSGCKGHGQGLDVSAALANVPLTSMPGRPWHSWPSGGAAHVRGEERPAPRAAGEAQGPLQRSRPLLTSTRRPMAPRMEDWTDLEAYGTDSGRHRGSHSQPVVSAPAYALLHWSCKGLLSQL
ncbi:Hypothetical predicted protein [Marmota monax]|uniref:Uncharacterized protein n=1 Tax=Marmota monax TaxID=9995 RepID=A0A5E4CXD5_MARMO|nr:hypothetical protein GHT09_019490 [Marmota monax]VTJ86498.1 Hypothetical predicted protein [Marmota monax]